MNQPVNLEHLHQIAKQLMALTEIERAIIESAIWEIEEHRGMHPVIEEVIAVKPHRLNLTKPRTVSKQEAAYYRAKGYFIEYSLPYKGEQVWMGMYKADWGHKNAKYQVTGDSIA